MYNIKKEDMIEKSIVRQNSDSRFMIVYHDPNTDVETFFGGFYNEIQCQGTEDESFSYDIENWVERPEDGAAMFTTIHDAKDFLEVIDEEKQDHCSIILYGRGDVENFMLGSYWYPLKVFVGGNGYECGHDPKSFWRD